MGRCIGVLAILLMIMVVCSQSAFGASGDLAHHGLTDNTKKTLAHGGGGGRNGETTSIKGTLRGGHGVPKAVAGGPSVLTVTQLPPQIADVARLVNDVATAVDNLRVLVAALANAVDNLAGLGP